MEQKDFKLSHEEVRQLLYSNTSNEHKYIEKYGDGAKATLLKMSNSTESVHSEKLNKDLTLRCSLVRERKESGGIVTFGATAYKIQILDGEKELGKCTYQIEPRGVHLSYIGLSEDLDATFQGIGLGSMMFAKLEAFCQAFGAEYIEGKFTPMGKFAGSSRAFYEKHGFNFDVDYADHGRTYVKKEIQNKLEKPADLESEKANSDN